MRGSTNSAGLAKPQPMIFKNLTIAASDWVEDSTLINYPYRAALSCPGVTADYWPYITFDPDFEEVSLCTSSQAFADGVFAYADGIPTEDITVLSVFCVPTCTSSGSISSSDAEVYTGAYTVSPSYATQTLDTEGTVMLNDVTVNGISVSTTSNNSGGNTVVIGD